MIAAAGSGDRLGAGGPKALVQLGGRPLLAWVLDAFRAVSRVGSIVVAAPPGEEERVAEELGVEAVRGGEHRSESVRAALELVEGDIAVVHDAARPLVTPELIDRVLALLAERGSADAVVAAAPVTDTIKEAGGDRIVERSLDRSHLWAVQTPQAFRVEALRRALDRADLSTASDDAMLIERAGGEVLICEAPPENLKVTTPLDLAVAEQLLRDRDGG